MGSAPNRILFGALPISLLTLNPREKARRHRVKLRVVDMTVVKVLRS